MPTKARTAKKVIRLKPSRTFRQFLTRIDRDERYDQLAWDRSPPFAVNKRGVLVHRVRHVTTYRCGGKASHHHIDYLCGNGCNVDVDEIGDSLAADPPRDRLLCLACEHRAAVHSLPSADELVGRHVHVGVLVARRVCCSGDS